MTKTYRCIEKCMEGHRIYNPGDKVVRDDGWENSNFEELTPANMIKKEEVPDLKEVGAIAGQGPQSAGEPPMPVDGSPGKTVEQMTAFLKTKGVEIPAGARKADLEALVDQVK